MLNFHIFMVEHQLLIKKMQNFDLYGLIRAIKINKMLNLNLYGGIWALERNKMQNFNLYGGNTSLYRKKSKRQRISIFYGGNRSGNMAEIEGAEFQSLWREYERNKEIKMQHFNLYCGNTSLRRICKDSAWFHSRWLNTSLRKRYNA